MTIADRLALALDDYAPDALRGDRKAFQRAMRARLGPERAQGTSYPAVLGYFGGKVSPSLEWVSVAADVLAVRPAWLAFRDGAPDGASVDPGQREMVDAVANQIRSGLLVAQGAVACNPVASKRVEQAMKNLEWLTEWANGDSEPPEAP
jgi:hypothetical protein